jgi:CrcB protein
MSFSNCIFVMAGGALGTLLRYLVALGAAPISQRIPWGTIFINASGSLLIGFFGTLTLASGRYPVSDSVRLFVMIGFCGGYTTFSSFSLQTLDLIRAGGLGRAALNVSASILLCIGAVAIGHLAAGRLNGDRADIVQSAIEEEA